LDLKTDHFTLRRGDHVVVEVRRRATEPPPVVKTRNPFGVTDVPDPDGPDIREFAKTVKLSSNDNDPNAAAWPVKEATGSRGNIDGEWQGRWNADGGDWHTGKATVRLIGDRVFILFEGAGSYLIEARHLGSGWFEGRAVNLQAPTDTYPWAGRLLGDNRIDGAWQAGRWDLRRRFVTRNPFEMPDRPDPHGDDIAASAGKVDLPGEADDANAAAWADKVTAGKRDSIDGEWSSRWKTDGNRIWQTGHADVRTIGDRVFIRYFDAGGAFVVE